MLVRHHCAQALVLLTLTVSSTACVIEPAPDPAPPDDTPGSPHKVFYGTPQPRLRAGTPDPNSAEVPADRAT